jgi:hypothetical protein
VPPWANARCRSIFLSSIFDDRVRDARISQAGVAAISKAPPDDIARALNAGTGA